MADPMTDERVTEIVRAATFGKAIRLADLVRASDLDSQRKEQFRKAISTVWMRGVRELAREVRRLRAELEADRSVGHGAKHWHDTYQQSMNAVDEFFVELLKLMPGAADVGMDAYDQIPRGIEKLKADYARAVAEVARLGTDRDRARAIAANAEKTLGEQIDRAVQAEAAAAVLQSAADEANRRITLARRTAAELHEFNSPEGEHLDGCPGCRLENELGEARPDPYLLALEEVAQRYPEAFAWHLANEQAKATRKDPR